MFLVALVFGFFAYWIENIGYTVAFWLVMFVIALLVASTMEFDEVPEEPPTVRVSRLDPGACLRRFTVPTAEPVACDRPHRAEIYAAFRLKRRPWPGRRYVIQRGQRGCASRVRLTYPPSPRWPKAKKWFASPRIDDWKARNRRITCAVEFAKPRRGFARVPG